MKMSEQELKYVYRIAVLVAVVILSIWGAETGALTGLLI